MQQNATGKFPDWKQLILLWMIFCFCFLQFVAKWIKEWFQIPQKSLKGSRQHVIWAIFLTWISRWKFQNCAIFEWHQAVTLALLASTVTAANRQCSEAACYSFKWQNPTKNLLAILWCSLQNPTKLFLLFSKSLQNHV